MSPNSRRTRAVPALPNANQIGRPPGAAAGFGETRAAPRQAHAATLMLAAGIAERLGVFRAGRLSATDPGYTIDAQRRRIGGRPQPQTPASVRGETAWPQ